MPRIQTMIRKITAGVFILVMLSSCRNLYPTLMFKDLEEQNVNQEDTANYKDYTIRKGDWINLQVFSNSGYQLVNVLSQGGAGGQMIQNRGLEYLVDNQGYVRFPVIDTVHVEGMTFRRAEEALEERYAAFYKKPFVVLRVTNRRVHVILGEGISNTINITNENTTLMEIIARSGGIGSNNKAYKIKLIRGSLHDPEVRIIDLRTKEGIEDAELLVQANDIIYVEPASRFNTGLSRAVAPYGTVIGVIVSSLTLLYLLSNR